jgi:broad specificity phosphatase PhoE
VGITSELLLTRHGQAHCNVAGVVGGPETCTGLTDLGRQQVKALAARLRDEHERSAIAGLLGSPTPTERERPHCRRGLGVDARRGGGPGWALSRRG